MTTDEAFHVAVGDGRRLRVRSYGDPKGRPVVMLHGTPGAGSMFTGTDKPARALGLCVYAPDRWAYGGSDAHPCPSLTAFAADIGVMMTAIGCDRFAVGGISGGGPYAAAVAAHLGDRVSAAALISPVGLIRDSVAAGEVGAFHRFCFGPLARSPRAVAHIFDIFAWSVAKSPRLACGLTTLRAPGADKQVMADCAVSERILRAFHDGLRPGSQGPAIDLSLFGSAWSFDPSTIMAPAKVWIGTKDTNVPVAAARRLAERIPGAELEVLDGEGHLWVAQHYEETLAWTAQASR